jgi:hypothetical protein
VIVRKLSVAVLGVCLGASLPGTSSGQEAPYSPRFANEPRPLPLAGLGFGAPATNQQLADAIAVRLRQGGQLHQYQIQISCQNGVAELSGRVADTAQQAAVLGIVRMVPGVRVVRDGLSVGQGPAIVPTQAVAPPAAGPLPPGLPMGPNLQPAPQVVPPPAGFGQPQEPTPIFQAPPGPNPTMQPPPLPPNAWPTVAPYNNYSRVAYPNLYPYEAWPFIGPFYPFPRVPLGWRSVTLTWQDGHWWYGKNATGHDWWRIRYW